MRGVKRCLVIAGLALAGGLIVAACSHEPATAPLTFMEERLDSLWVEPVYSDVRDSGLLVAMATPADTSFRLPSNARLKLQLTTSGGDSEEWAFWPYMCGNRDCSAVTITMNDGYDVTSLQSFFFSIPSRLWSVSVTGRIGGLRLFDPARMATALDLISRQSTVQVVEADQIGTGGFATLPRWHVLSAIPIDFRTPRHNDGVLQVASAQTIELRYVQPDSSFLSITMVIP